ncbi:zinc finger homeobox protein 4-like [Periophthalmus magnuspinnatus]|uniref:zinc finger homeobox protein 4-like n=1 Tax=Periophthalmus magnuspinnatus TaxID=409849 RepID=UPI00145A2BC1|nr:zinc finger homeobox protein 4-like [Periophthalmus magnuspinnatus]
MDSGEGGDGGGGEERESDLSPQGLSAPLRSRAAIPEQGSPTHTSAMAPAKELLTLSPQGPEEVQGDEQTEEGLKGNQREGCSLGRWREDGEVHLGVEEASVTGSGGQEEEEAISNQSQNKSKCSLLPQQSQHCSSSSTAQASGTHDSKTDPTPSSSPKPAPSLSASPKHFTCPSSSSALHPDLEVKDIKEDQGWISGFPQSFKSQQSTAMFPTLAGMGPASSPTAEDGGPTGVLHSSVTNGNGAKAPEPNDSQPETEVDDEREKEDLKEAVTKNLNQDLSPNSLTSHMTIMHSRNSCKTLKCPKCNWHYKSQHTLQVHMKEKHPETGGQCVCGGSGGKCVCGGAARGVCTYCSSGKPHPRLARGETYACGYKPYRCEVCDYATSSKGNLSIHMQSDKHLNNVQSGGNTNGHMHVSNSSTPGGHTVDEQAYKLPLALHTPATQPAKITSAVHSHSHGGKRWRCDVCDYETSIARNLRIHTTSEKHTHNMLRLQRGYYLSQCRGLAPPLKHLQNTSGELSLSMRLSSQQVPEPPVTLGSALTPSPSPSPSPPPAASLSPSGALSLCVFQCMICSSFSSDSLESVEQHLNSPRSLPQSEWCSLVAGGCHCRLCGYTTPLRANFSLHCQTDRHRTRYQLAAHLQEGGDRGQEGAALIAKGNPVQLRCNLCDYVSSSLEKLRGHSLSAQHKAGIRVYRFLQQYDGEVDGGSWLFHCLLCNHSCSSKIQVLKHSQTPTHQQREGLIQLQPMGGEELAAIFTIRKNTEGVTEELSDEMDTTIELQIGLLDQTKDTSNAGSNLFSTEKENGRQEQEKGELKRSFSECTETDDAISNKRPKTHQQNENQQTVQCPLCQLKVPYANIRQHLTHVHSVAQDCVDKLISTVTPPVEEPALHSKVEASPDSCTDEHKMKNGKTSNAKTTDAIASADAQKNGISTETTESEVAAPKDVTALLTPPLEDNTTHPSNGKVAPQSPSSPPTSPSSDPPPLTDRHGYRFRCSRCSLAFPTQEKLQLHWQYHAMRAATECPLCSRQCRSQEALQRHMQNTHSGQQLDNSQGQNTHLLPHTAHYMEHNKSAVQQDFSLSPQIGQEAGEGEEMEEEEALESEKKEQLKEIVGEVEEEGLTDTEKHEETITEPSFTEAASNSLIKKSSNPTLDRYLDPSRPYKCTICSESFTQKTILLVHFNSVSHLHRARRALQDSSAGSTSTTETPRGPDPRPYRCKLCGVGYSQSSTLDIHLRSVLHQTRARAAQNTSASAPTTSTQAREEPSKSSSLTKRPDVASSSLLSNSLAAEAQSALVNSECQQAKKRVAELLASRNQLMLLQQQQLAQAQAQAQAHLQQQTALLQSQVMHHLPMGLDNLLKHHFPVAADNLLSLQQQLLLPFYLAGDIKLNSELAGKISDLNQFDFTNSILKESSKTVDKNESSAQTTEKQSQNESSDGSVYQQNEKCEVNSEESSNDPTFDKTKKEPRISEVDKGEVPLPPVKNESQKQEVNVSPINLLGQQCPPPRVPYAAVNGEPLRALLQSYGYELALQYIQSRHRHQQQSLFIEDKQNCSEQLEACLKQGNGVATEEEDGLLEVCNKVDLNKVETESFPLEINGNKPEDEKKERTCCGDGKKCKDCGKFFSDALILKSHQEYIHRMLFPTSALEKFSREYRSQYDQMYPITQSKSTESSSVATTSTAKSTNEELESIAEEVNAQMKPCASSELLTVSEPPKQTSTSPSDVKTLSTASSSPPSPKAPALSQQEEATTPSTSGTTQAKTMPLSLPKIPMLPLPLPQLQIPPLPLSKLPMPPIPFPMDLPLLSPVVMQSVALQPQPWLDSNANPDLAKLYQSQLNPALLGQQPQSSPALLAQQSPLSPALLAQPSQLNTPLLGQASQPSPVPAGQQPQMSPSILEQQGKRTRTRISEEQLAILRKHFDINSLPSDEEINKMSATSGLPHKVIKHWFRNTLFKERQRDKDSPYNFNNPPTTALEESREEETQSQSLSVSSSTMSPALTSVTAQPQPVDLPRELHRGRRSSRTRFTEQQLETLQGVFEATPYPREEEYERLSALLSLPNRVIVVWFQNARQRARKNQDRGNEESFGGESKSHFDNIHSQSNGSNMNHDEEESSRCVDGQGDSHNENSMDLTYEYYTNPDSPAPESSAYAVEPVKKIQVDKANLGHDSKTTKNVDESVKNIDSMHTLLPEKGEGTQDREQPCSSSQKIAPMSDPRKESTNPPPIEKSAVIKSFDSEDRGTPSSLNAETKQQSTSQPLPTAQFQCTFCPMSLPSFQLWQEHQTRHLLAAQSQVQLLHSGFTDRTMPYMMLHPNHTLMANQMLSGTMSQLHPNAPHPMISHLNSLQMKNTLPDHSGSLSQNALASLKQNSKLMTEVNFESQRSGKDVEEEHRRDKRQRTTITPEQLDVLYQRYSMDSNPTRGVLESIARDVGLTRRVVQVWFQNTRARERKGQFRSMGPGSTFSLGLNHLRCPFCRALFKVKSALDAHMRSRHWAEAERAGFNLSISNGSSGQIATSSVMERPGPSISSHLTHPAYPVSKEPNSRPAMSSLTITTDLNNPDEDEDYEEEEDEYPCEESSSMADLASSSPEGSGGPSSDWGETPNLQQNYQHSQQQRQRTQMSHFQILQLRDFYRTHRTPNRQECEALGQELGLPHRVVQVWFQNARAKEKRARSMSSDSVEREAELSAGAGERDRA